MSKSNATETSLLGLIFNATTWNLIAENDTTSPAANLTVNLHIGDPGEGGNTTTSPPTYSPYAAVNVARTAGGWTVAGATATNAALVQFPQCASGSDTISHVSIAAEGSTAILYSGQLSVNLNVAVGIQPQFAIGALSVTED